MAVTDSALLAGRDLPAACVAAVRGGATCVQLRDKDSSDADFLAQARRVVHALRPFQVPVILNDRVHLVEAAGADGAHVGQTDLSAPQARALLGPARILGVSIEHLGQEAHLRPGLVDYLGASPVFATTTKADVAPPLGLFGVQELAKAGFPVVGIGGIGRHNARAVLDAGAAGIAVVSALFATPDPEGAARALRQVLDAADGVTTPRRGPVG
jgi:thiamine-phosphate pyrophosphorylase